MDRQIGTSNILETLVKSNFDVKSIENLKDEIYVVNNIETKHPYRLTLEDKNNKLIRPTYDPNFLDSDILAEVQRAVSATVPVEFDFDINILTDKNGKDTLSVIKIEKVIYDAK